MGNKKSVLVENMNECLICGNPNIEIHHCFFGVSKRHIADEYGYIVPLCSYHHKYAKDSPHRNRDVDLKYKRLAQRHYEAYKGNREDFIRLMGKSYIY